MLITITEEDQSASVANKYEGMDSLVCAFVRCALALGYTSKGINAALKDYLSEEGELPDGI